MRHGIGEWPLKKTRWRGARERISLLEVGTHIPEHRVEASHLRGKVWLGLGSIPAPDEERTRVAEYARHVPHELGRCAHVGTGAEVAEIRRRIAQRFCVR